MAEFIIREVHRSDVHDILEIYQPHIEEGWTSFEEVVPGEEDMWARMRGYMETCPWLVATAEEAVIGYAYANPYRARAAYRWCVEVSVYVSPEWHGRGVAFKLYKVLFKMLESMHIREIFAGISLPNVPSERFHRKMGFTPVALYNNVGYKFGRWHNVVWLQKTLDRSDPPVEPVHYPNLSREVVAKILGGE